MELADVKFRLLVESVKDYAIYLLDPAGVIQSWNAGAMELKGYRAEEVVGQHFSMFFTPEDRGAGKPAQLLAQAIAEGRVEDVGWRIRKDGSQFWASAVITPLYDGDGHHFGFAKVTRDLTERGYRSFVEATHAIVWVTDPQGRPSADSPSWRELTGQTEAEWRDAVHAWDAVHPDDASRVHAAWTQTLATGEPLDLELRMRRHDGVYLWMTVHAVPLRQADGTIREWFGALTDISERKRAEDLLATTLRSIGDAVIATDLEGRVTFMNVVAERLTGWVADDARGRPLREVFPIFNEDTGQPVESPVDKVLREGVVVGLANHTVLHRKDGAAIPIDDSAAPIRDRGGALEGVVLVFRDVSAEKQELHRRLFLSRATEEIIHASDHKDALRRIAALAVPRMADWVGVDVVDPTTGRLQQLAIAHVDPTKIEFARQLAERYPSDPDAPTGAPNVLRTGRSELYPEIPETLLEAGARDPEHLRILRELQLRSAMVVPLIGRQSVFGTITMIFAGTTPRRYSEQDVEIAEELARRVALLVERRRLEEQAEAANRMKDEFLATISHELRTPLQAILGYGTMLERNVAPDPSKAVTSIVRNAQTQARLVEDMLDMSRILAGKLRLSIGRASVAAAVRGAIEAIRPAAEVKNVAIVERIPADIGQVNGDLDRLQQVLWNLLSNAVKFTPRDGRIEIAARRIEGAIQLQVHDTGQGIPADQLGAIFERFRQVDSSSTRSRSGLGLGLAIVKYLVEAHGGTITAESPGRGAGATFTVTLPAHPEPLPTPIAGTPALTAASAARLQGISVLVVDDDDDTRESIVDALASCGADVAQAASGAEAHDAIQQHQPQLLLCDIGMPVEDGYALLQRIRRLPPERGGNVPAVALTAYARPDDIARAEAAGFMLHLAKPVGFTALIEAVRSCVFASR